MGRALGALSVLLQQLFAAVGTGKTNIIRKTLAKDFILTVHMHILENRSMIRTKPFVPCDILFVQEDTAALVIGLLSIEEESGLMAYPGSCKADEV